MRNLRVWGLLCLLVILSHSFVQVVHARPTRPMFGGLSVVSGVVVQASYDANGALDSAIVNTALGTVSVDFTSDSILRVVGTGEAKLQPGDRFVAIVNSNREVVVAVATHSEVSPRATIRGTISAVDTSQKTVTIEFKKPDRTTSTLTLKVTDGETQIRKDGKQADLSALAVKDQVEVVYRLSDLVALRIEARTPPLPKIEGTIYALGENKNKLIVELKRGGFMEFSVNEETVILLDGKTVTFADLKQGLRVSVFYRAESGVNLALRVEAQSPKPQKVQGVVTEVDATSGQITLAVHGDTSQKRTFVVTQDTHIEVEGQSATLEKVIVGAPVVVEFVVKDTQNVAINIEVQALPKVEGFITEVSGEKLSVKTVIGESVEIQLTSETQITLDEKPANVQSLGKDLFAVVTFARQMGGYVALKVEASHSAPERKVRGVIQAVGKGQLTLKTEIGKLELVLTDSTEVFLDGQSATVGELKVGQRAEVIFQPQPDKNMALKVEAQSPPVPRFSVPRRRVPIRMKW